MIVKTVAFFLTPAGFAFEQSMKKFGIKCTSVSHGQLPIEANLQNISADMKYVKIQCYN